MEYPKQQPYTVQDLVNIIAILRDPENGCPWDKVQTHQSIRMNFLEEAYEAVDAIDLDDPALLCEELGDVLMQVVFHTRIEEEAGRFSWAEVCDGVCRKLVLRHPNIFGAAAGFEGIKDWDALKNREKGRVTPAQDLDSVPRALPALMRAAKLQKRAARYPELTQPQADGIDRAAEQLRRAEPGSEQARLALGELLFETVALARKQGLDPEEALQQRNEAFARQALPTTTD